MEGCLPKGKLRLQAAANRRVHPRHFALRRSGQRAVGESARDSMVDFFCALETQTRRPPARAEPFAGDLSARDRSYISRSATRRNHHERFDSPQLSLLRIRAEWSAAL